MRSVGSRPARLYSWMSVSAGGALLAWSLLGVVETPYERSERILSVNTAIEGIDSAFEQHGRSDAFFQKATELYSEAIDYQWPIHRARVQPADNWILYLAGYVDPLLVRIGLTNVENLFTAFESSRWERAMGRGFGICSQNALGLAGLLEDRYDIPADVIALDGHVVVEADGRLLDPSVGLTLLFDLEQAEKREAEQGAVSQIYQAAFEADVVTRVYDLQGNLVSATPYAELGKYYDAAGNQRIGGARAYRPKIFWIERVSDYLKWFIPLALMAAGFWGLRRSCVT